MRTIDILQVLRFAAALLVLFYHVSPEAAGITDVQTLFSFVRNGGSGVDIFFVISGFIITLTVMRKPVFDVPAFTLNRFFRIYPTYWLFLTLAVLLGYVSYRFTGSSGTFELVSPSSLTVSYLLAPLPVQIYPVAWTLTLEVSFYVIFCISYRAAGLRGVVVALLAWYAATWIAAPFVHSGQISFIWFFHSVVLEFLYGVIIAWLWLTDRIRWAAPVFVLGVVAYVGVVVGVVEVFAVGREIKWGLPAALLVYGAVGISWKAPRLAVLAGDSSYILYLMHPLIITVVKVLGLRLFGIDTFESSMAALVIVMISVSLSMLLSHWIERPYISWYKGFIARLIRNDKALAPGNRAG